MAMPSFNLVSLTFVTLYIAAFGENVKSLSQRVLMDSRPKPYASPLPPRPMPPVTGPGTRMSGF